VVGRPGVDEVADADVRDDARHPRQQHRPAFVVDGVRAAPGRVGDRRLDPELDELRAVRLERAQ
jgi:hypothetical protein